MDISMNPGQSYSSASPARTGLGVPGVSRHFHGVDWKSIVAGTVTALGIQLILTMFATGIAAAKINPASEPGMDATPFSVGAAAWLVISGVISFMIGGMVAGCASLGHHTAPVTEKDGVAKVDAKHSGRNGALHGALTWSLAAVLGAMMAAMAGAAVSAGGAAGAGSAAGQMGGATSSGTGTGGFGGSSMFGWSGWGIPAAQNGWSFAGAPQSGANTTDSASGDRNIAVVGPYGQRQMITEADARVMAERAASAASKAIITTTVAFALAMVAASIGGMLGRQRAERRHGYVYA